MNSEWLNFTQDQGVLIANNHVDYLPQSSVCCDLSTVGVIEITGDDAQTFLQSQLTNDVLTLAVGQSQINSFCNAKGRIFAMFRLLHTTMGYYVLLPHEMLPDLIKRFNLFKLRSKVSITDVSDIWVNVGVVGATVAEKLQTIFSELPTLDAVIQSDQAMLWQMPGVIPRFQIMASNNQMRFIWTTLLDNEVVAVNSNVWQLQDIRAGIANIYLATKEVFVPQMVNLELVNGLSFTKGCYPGQEIVARMHYLGEPKRRLFHASVQVDNKPEAGDEIYAGDKVAGQIVEAAQVAEQQYEVSMVVYVKQREADLTLGHNGASLSWLTLPYSL